MATAALQIVRNVTFLRIEDDLPLAQWQLAMAWHPDHMSHETRLFLNHANQHLLENPQLLDPEAYRGWL